jgi:3D-(3,5/4)-trihydroxycyclohexane-1,2-dione acylhydrolase (decyclizing)
VSSLDELRKALEGARAAEETTVIHVETDPGVNVPRFFWWDVAVAEVSASEAVDRARATYEEERAKARQYL